MHDFLSQLLIVDDALATNRVLSDQLFVGLQTTHLSDSVKVFADNMPCFLFVDDTAQIECLFGLSALIVIKADWLHLDPAVVLAIPQLIKLDDLARSS